MSMDIRKKNNDIAYTLCGKTNNYIPVRKFGGFMWLEILTIPMHIDLKRIKTLEIIIGGSIICSIPFSLLLKLSKITIANMNFIIEIPTNIFFTFSSLPVLLYKILYHEFGVNLIKNFKKLNKVSAESQNTNTDFDFQITMRHNDQDILNTSEEKIYLMEDQEIKQYITINIVNDSNVKGRILRRYLFGIYVETDEIIKKIKIKSLKSSMTFISCKINWRHHVSKFIKDILSQILANDIINHVICQFIQSNLYWIPIDDTSFIKQNLSTNWNEIIIEFDKNITGQIHFIQNNVLRYMSGMAGDRNSILG